VAIVNSFTYSRLASFRCLASPQLERYSQPADFAALAICQQQIRRWLKDLYTLCIQRSNQLQQPKVFGLKFSFKKLKGFFPLQYAILSFGKCLNY